MLMVLPFELDIVHSPCTGRWVQPMDLHVFPWPFTTPRIKAAVLWCGENVGFTGLDWKWNKEQGLFL